MKRAVSFFIIVLTMFLVSLPVDGLAKSKLKKCPKDMAFYLWNNCFGIFDELSGVKYVGEWRDGHWHGQGTIKFAGGMKYVGGWRNDKRHGQGTLTHADGSKIVGTWRNDKLVKRTR